MCEHGLADRRRDVPRRRRVLPAAGAARAALGEAARRRARPAARGGWREGLRRSPARRSTSLLLRRLFVVNPALWFGEWVFHATLALVLLRHLRYFTAPGPGPGSAGRRRPGGSPASCCRLALLYVLAVRLLAGREQFSSRANLLLLLDVLGDRRHRPAAGTRHRVDLVQVKLYALGTVTFHPAPPPADWLLATHLALVLALLLYVPSHVFTAPLTHARRAPARPRAGGVLHDALSARSAPELSPAQLLEIDACTQCGECLKHCPVQDVTGNPAISPPEKIRMFREFLRATDGLKARLFGPGAVDPQLLRTYVKAVYECTTCGACGQDCPVGDLHAAALAGAAQGDGQARPRAARPAGEAARRRSRAAATPTTSRRPSAIAPWFPANVAVAERADIAYYAGCTGAYEAQPMVRGDALVLGAIGEPFTMLPPEEEVCCGFPLFITGQHDLLADLVQPARRGLSRPRREDAGLLLPLLREHHVARLAGALRRGAALHGSGTSPSSSPTRSAAGSCGSRGNSTRRVIYHDPCYLSRGVGVIEEPREVLRSIPGLTLLEFERHGLDSRCCGIRRRGAQGVPRERDHDGQADHRRGGREEGGPADPGLPGLLREGQRGDAGARASRSGSRTSWSCWRDAR